MPAGSPCRRVRKGLCPLDPCEGTLSLSPSNPLQGIFQEQERGREPESLNRPRIELAGRSQPGGVWGSAGGRLTGEGTVKRPPGQLLALAFALAAHGDLLWAAQYHVLVSAESHQQMALTVVGSHASTEGVSGGYCRGAIGGGRQRWKIQPPPILDVFGLFGRRKGAIHWIIQPSERLSNRVKPCQTRSTTVKHATAVSP